ncbi:hypothetical protein ACS0TY_003873 [Phlomoides rotata]
MTLQKVGRSLYSASEFTNLDMDPHVRSAYEDCLELLDHSVDLLTNSLTSAASGGELSSSIQDVLTCLSAALTNQDTCTKGFDELNGDVKHQMSDRVKDLSEHGEDFSDIPIQNRQKGRGERINRKKWEKAKIGGLCTDPINRPVLYMDPST